MTASAKKKGQSIEIDPADHGWGLAFQRWSGVEGRPIAVPTSPTGVVVQPVSATKFSLFGPSVAERSTELADLREQVEELKTRVEAYLGIADTPCREIPREQAKKEVLEFFTNTAASGIQDPIYPSDCAAVLDLDAVLVTDLCDELEAEGLLQ